MTQEASSADPLVEADKRLPEQSSHRCSICDATDGVSEASFLDTDTTVYLCPRHYQLFAILGRSTAPRPTQSVDTDWQQTSKVTVRVPKALLDSADMTAEDRGQTRSEVVRDALQILIELQEVNDAATDVLTQAVTPSDASEEATETPPPTTDHADADVAFLKERIRTLESLLEDSIEKL